LDVISTNENPNFADDSLHIDRAFWWAYNIIGVGTYVPGITTGRICTFITGWTTADGTINGDTVLVYAFEPGIMPAFRISDIYGMDAPGASRHRQGLHLGVQQESQKVPIGDFRPKSGEPWPVFRTLTPTAVVGQIQVPSRYVLNAYPNPFNATTLLRYSVPTAGHVTMAIYSIEGRLVKTLVDRDVAAGTHETEWEGRGNDGNEVGSGAYVIRLASPAGVVTTKLTLLR